MRTRTLLAFITISTLALVACGGGGGDDQGDDGDDTAAPDASTAAPDAAENTVNALGQVCSFAAPDCPAGNVCTGIEGVGSTENGYCSPMCMNMNALCSGGYTGPAGGQPVCALSEAAGADPTLCAIVCQDGTQCPAGLDCIPVPDQPQPVSVCAPPA
jgi:hypothetical protein